MTIKKLKLFLKKPSMPFHKTILLGLIEVGLMIIGEINGGYYKFLHIVINALVMTIVIALFLQVIRLINEINK